MNNVLKYKGYSAKIEFDVDDQVLFGKVEGIADLVTFESNSAENIAKEFENAVDDYLCYCKEVGKDPDKPYNGQFNVRISPELHKKAAMEAIRTGVSLNAVIAEAIEKYFSDTQPSYIINNNYYQPVKNDDIIVERNRISSEDDFLEFNPINIIN
ncbi:MAG: type II toxin-antitoxin system HicB family antitoxin [Clostridia bacterium]|nr:type II toxin-antitoxin system HicB family antitoxin [Clostridia bacterium]